MRSGEDRDQHRAGRVVPGGRRHRPFRVPPFDVGQAGGVERFAGQEGVARQGRVAAARLGEPAGEGDQRGVGLAPANGGRRVVLGVGVVVAPLAEAELGAHRQHRGPARGEQQREEVALVARPRRDDRRVLRRPLDAVTPGIVRVGSVSVVFAVRLVVLLLVRDQVGEGESVVRDDEVHALRRRGGAREHVARAGHSGRDLAAHAWVSAPEAARGVAEAVVPFGEGGAERSEAIAAGAEVPGFGDEARLAQNRVFGELPEKQRVGVEAVRSATERGGEVEAEAVDPAMNHPAPERADRHVDDERPVERETIAGARVIDVSCRIVRVEAEPGGVVEAAERERRPELIAFAVVIENDVENRLHPRRVQRVGRRPHFGPAAGSKARVGRAEHDGIVPPGVRQAERRKMPFVDKGVGRHDLDRRRPERGQMGDRGRMGESGECSPRALRNRGIEARKTAQVEFVDDQRLGGDPLASRFAAGRGAGDRFGRVRSAVFAMFEHRGMQAERTVEAEGVGVSQQFGSVEPAPSRRIIRAFDPETVARPFAEARREASKHRIVVAFHRGPKNLAIAIIEAKKGGFGVRQRQRRLEPVRQDDDPEGRLGSAHAAVRDIER